MSHRGLSNDLITELVQSTSFPVHFVSIAFVSGTIRLHNSVGTYNWDDGGGAADWLGVGDLGGIAGIEETNDLAMNNIQLILSSIDTDIRDEVLNLNDYYLSDVIIYLGAVNAQGVLVADPDLFWSGFLEDLSMSAGNKDGDVVIATCASEISRLQRTRKIKFTDQHQQQRYSGDIAFEYMDQIEGARPSWRGVEGTQIVAVSRLSSGFSLDNFPFGPAGRFSGLNVG